MGEWIYEVKRGDHMLGWDMWLDSLVRGNDKKYEYSSLASAALR